MQSVTKSPTSPRHGETTLRRRHDYPSPTSSASPAHERFGNYRSEAFNPFNEGRPRRSSQPHDYKPASEGTSLTRGGSLRERYPGDTSHRPLDTLRKDEKTARRAPHLRKKNFQGADRIDRLDNTTFSYHHEGPYDAANISRNLNPKYSPIAAVKDSNEEALKATPREAVIDALTKHRPIDGVAITPPGMADRFGRILDYEEGTDLMREPGADYKRWPGVEYLPGDLKGKGEPSYTIEKALKEHKQNGESGESGIELQSRRRNHSIGSVSRPSALPAEGFDTGNGLGRSNTTGKSLGGKLKKRFGSIRRKHATEV
jgi:hypothetical protein